jgi:hypothetical protein
MEIPRLHEVVGKTDNSADGQRPGGEGTAAKVEAGA